MIELLWTDSVPKTLKLAYKQFLQKMANRICVGHFQYGAPDRKKMYMTRIEKELAAYKKTGNQEHLINIANYCFLETECPENWLNHFDHSVPSVTRGKVK